MRLLNTLTLTLEEFLGSAVPPYVILSHTWGSQEVTFQEMVSGIARTKLGFKKIELCCRQGREDGYKYAWIDTCCIDKTSSAELSEAINSMYGWYQRARICYVYLSDTKTSLYTREETRTPSRWFKRGWTLQELIAPSTVEFYDYQWDPIGTRGSLADFIFMITGIDRKLLLQNRQPSEFSIAQRFSWAARRQTTRVEDRAYSLLGLFDVHMPLLYGEGDKAFERLQKKILKNNSDTTIFAWSKPMHLRRNRPYTQGLLAGSLDDFAGHESIVSKTMFEASIYAPWAATQMSIPTLAPTHTLVQLPFSLDPDNKNAAIACVGYQGKMGLPDYSINEYVCIFLTRHLDGWARYSDYVLIRRMRDKKFNAEFHQTELKVFYPTQAWTLSPQRPSGSSTDPPTISLWVLTACDSQNLRCRLAYHVDAESEDPEPLLDDSVSVISYVPDQITNDDLEEEDPEFTRLSQLEIPSVKQSGSSHHCLILKPADGTWAYIQEKERWGICAIEFIDQEELVWGLILFLDMESHRPLFYLTPIDMVRNEEQDEPWSGWQIQPKPSDHDCLENTFTHKAQTYNVVANVKPQGCSTHKFCECSHQRVNVALTKSISSPENTQSIHAYEIAR